jgi:integrase
MSRRVREPLTALKVKKAKPGLHCDGEGLYLQVRPNGGRSWIFRYTSPDAGKPRYMGLGTTRVVSLAQARLKALELRRQLLLDRTDPLSQVQAARTAARSTPTKALMPTFEECMKLCLHERLKGTSSDYQTDSDQQLRKYAVPLLGAKRIGEIVRDDVLAVLTPIWTTKHVTAKSVRSLMSRVFKWAVYKEYRADDPAAWKGYLDNALARSENVHTIKNFEAVAIADMPALIAKLHAKGDIKYRASEFTVLTAARSIMTRDAEWSEIDDKNRIWTIPKAKMKWRRKKATKDFRVPLTDRMLAILAEMKQYRRNKFVFPGVTADRLNQRAQLDCVKEMTGDDSKTIHGCRSTFRTWAQGLKGQDGNPRFDRETIEFAMAHKVYSEVEERYARGDLLDIRRSLMELWEQFCQSQK